MTLKLTEEQEQTLNTNDYCISLNSIFLAPHIIGLDEQQKNKKKPMRIAGFAKPNFANGDPKPNCKSPDVEIPKSLEIFQSSLSLSLHLPTKKKTTSWPPEMKNHIILRALEFDLLLRGPSPQPPPRLQPLPRQLAQPSSPQSPPILWPIAISKRQRDYFCSSSSRKSN